MTETRSAEYDAETEIARRAKDMARLSLFSFTRNIPIRKEDLVKSVLKEHGKQFPKALEKSQNMLRDICGLELSDLIMEGQGVGRGKNMYVLKSTLSVDVRELLDEQDRRQGIQDDATPETWITQQHIAQRGLVLMIITGLYLKKGSMDQDEFVELFKRFNLEHTDEMPHPQLGTTVKSFVETLIKQGYIDRTLKTGVQSTQHAEAGDGKSAGLLHRDRGKSYIYKLGQRAVNEVGFQGMEKVIRALYDQDHADGICRDMRQYLDMDEEIAGAIGRPEVPGAV